MQMPPIVITVPDGHNLLEPVVCASINNQPIFITPEDGHNLLEPGVCSSIKNQPIFITPEDQLGVIKQIQILAEKQSEVKNELRELKNQAV